MEIKRNKLVLMNLVQTIVLHKRYRCPFHDEDDFSQSDKLIHNSNYRKIICRPIKTMKRQRSSAAVAGSLSFAFAPAPLPCAFVVEHIGETNDYALKLRKPFLPLKAAQKCSIIVQPGVCMLALTPSNRKHRRSELLDRVYHAYETHTLALDEAETTVLAVYLQFDEELQLKVNPDALWLGTRMVALDWFPPDVDPTLYGLKVDPKRIPQRGALWKKLRGPVTGRKATTYLGYWVPTKEVDPNWTIDAEPTFSDAATAAMRLGTQNEHIGVRIYLDERPKAIVSAVGWCDVPKPYPRGWGASPDGLIRDPTTAWSTIPADIQKYYVDNLNAFDPSRGVLEIKVSQHSLAFSDYFLPQVYMEMIAAGVLWCDLLRYRPPANARIYRIYRHKPTEEQILGLIRIALATPKPQLQDLLHKDQRWIRARQYLEAVAQGLAFTDVRVVPTLGADWKAYCEQLYTRPEMQEIAAEVVEDDSSLKEQALKKLQEALDLVQQLK